MRENENTPDEYAFSMFGYNSLNDFEDELLTQIYSRCLFSTCNHLFERKVNPHNNHV